MNFRLPNIPPSRRLFLGAVVVIVGVLGWALTKEWRTGVRDHYVAFRSNISPVEMLSYFFSGYKEHMELGTNRLACSIYSDGPAVLSFGYQLERWQFARCQKKYLQDVSLDDARSATFDIVEGWTADGMRISSFQIRWGEIVFGRRVFAPEIVYALQAVEQKDGRGHFRSRRILPEAKEGRAVSNAVPFAPANR